jgi:hypothetical protein
MHPSISCGLTRASPNNFVNQAGKSSSRISMGPPFSFVGQSAFPVFEMVRAWGMRSAAP